ncbi:MAG: hypothetical protein HYZ68_05575 [Chloroflexi bacterium]|nr:hypothetical protein [Chloroflexota bacterium]
MRLDLITATSVVILVLATVEVLRGRGKGSRPLILLVAILQVAWLLGFLGEDLGNYESRVWALIAAGMILAFAIDLYRAPEGQRGELIAAGLGLAALVQLVIGTGLVTLTIG